MEFKSNTQNEGETNFEIIGYEHPNWNSGMERWEWTVRIFTDEEKESLTLSGYTLENADTQHDILVLLKDSASSYEEVDEYFEKFCEEVETL